MQALPGIATAGKASIAALRNAGSTSKPNINIFQVTILESYCMPPCSMHQAMVLLRDLYVKLRHSVLCMYSTIGMMDTRYPTALSTAPF
jgi:hypothetical protein